MLWHLINANTWSWKYCVILGGHIDAKIGRNQNQRPRPPLTYSAMQSASDMEPAMQGLTATMQL
jgi:hypothetical protein